jgi:chitin disaccharide deacetylase
MILCADDYGIGDDVDRAILDLCGRKHLSAVSCLTALQRCGGEALKPLLEHQAGVDIGLHLCFADETLPPLENATQPLPAFGNFFRQSLRGRIRAGQVRQRVAAQYELFLKKCGRPPDFIDGHLHAHQLPGVREGLLEFVLSLPAQGRPYVRNTRQPLKTLRSHQLPWVKAAFIGRYGARLSAELRAAGVATNDGFAGIYDFGNYRRYPDYFPRFAACLPKTNGILVVHPGANENWRREEFTVLRDANFASGSPNRFQRQSPAT